MSFETTLSKIAEGCDASAVALMGSDGIAIAEVEGPAASEDAVDQLTMVGAEFGRILDEIRKASDSVGGGGVDEVSLRLSGLQVMLRVVDAETMLVVTLPSEANSGRARFEMRRQLLALQSEL
ncbi:MAG: hypothetical protein QNK05_05240 [Myxococcota bacterium]|nr:hypothetical protein [Myxococcota bacterium]